jgi:hypothetical protein
MAVVWDDKLDAPANKTLQMLINGALAKQGLRQSARAARAPDR